MKIKNKKRGYSVIEIIIYLAIFTATSILVINSFIVIMSSWRSTRSNHELLNSGTVAMERISREIRQAKNIDIANSVFDSNSGVLRLNGVDGLSYIEFEKNGNNLNILKNGELLDNLLNNNIYLNNLTFRRISTLNSEAVKVEMEIMDSRSKTNQTEKFYDTIILRGGY